MSTVERYSCLEEQLCEQLNIDINFKVSEPLGGGCISQVSKITDNNGRHWLLKENAPELQDMLTAEADGLKEIAATETIRVPNVYSYGCTDQFAYLLMEFIDLESVSASHKTAEQLAMMHRVETKQFGWFRDNTIGSTHQSNQQLSSWVEFWKTQRLLPQLKMALANGYAKQAYDDGLKLAESLDGFFSGYQPIASLLHGDLWGGNQAQDTQGNPVIFDPAVYYGDREADIAMTELFGGFSTSFYTAYNACFEMDKGYKVRKRLYNLYHILNHYNLFGASYQGQAASTTRRLLAELS